MSEPPWTELEEAIVRLHHASRRRSEDEPEESLAGMLSEPEKR